MLIHVNQIHLESHANARMYLGIQQVFFIGVFICSGLLIEEGD